MATYRNTNDQKSMTRRDLWTGMKNAQANGDKYESLEEYIEEMLDLGYLEPIKEDAHGLPIL